MNYFVKVIVNNLQNTWEYYGAFLLAQTEKNLPAMRQTWIWSLVWEDPLEKGKGTHSSILAWRIPWTEEPGGLQSMGSQRILSNWVTSLSLSFHKSYCENLQNTWDYYNNILYLFYHKPFQWFSRIYWLDWEVLICKCQFQAFVSCTSPPTPRKLHQTTCFSKYFHRRHTPKLSHQPTHSFSPVPSSDKTLVTCFEEHHFHEKPCPPERLPCFSITRLMIRSG